MNQLELFEAIIKSSGVAVGVLVLMCIFLSRCWSNERTDRREAWKSHNELAKETNKILKDLTVVLEVMKTEVLKGK